MGRALVQRLVEPVPIDDKLVHVFKRYERLVAAPPQDFETVVEGIAPHAIWDVVFCDKGLHRHRYNGLENLKEHALVQVDQAVDAGM